VNGTACKALKVASWAIVFGCLAGCEGPQPRACTDATRRWSAARAQLKAKLAGDQFVAGNVEAAAAELAEALRLDPGNTDLVLLQARIWLAEGKLAAAEELLVREAADPSPPRPPAGGPAEIDYWLGVVRQQQQRWPEALESFQRAVENDGEEVAYVVAVAQAYLQLGRASDALEFLRGQADKFAWTNAYQAVLAECYEQARDWASAASAWRRVVCGESAAAGLRQRLALSLFRAGQYAEAASTLTELLAEGQSDSADVLRLTLAECQLALGRTAAARASVETVLQAQPDDVRALRLLARCHAVVGEYGAALRVAERALGVDAHAVATLELAAALAWRSGDRALAARRTGQLLELDRQNRVALQIRQHISESGEPAAGWQ
jgi:tetratricopeptide (TPR) repeat protein